MQLPTSILNRWKNYFCLLLNALVCGVDDAGQSSNIVLTESAELNQKCILGFIPESTRQAICVR
jgi:hypothetical protein